MSEDQFQEAAAVQDQREDLQPSQLRLADFPEAGTTNADRAFYFAGIGCRRAEIARVLGVPVETLERDYATELSDGDVMLMLRLRRGLSLVVGDAGAATLASLIARQEEHQLARSRCEAFRPLRRLSDEELEESLRSNPEKSADCAKEKETRALERDLGQFVREAWRVLYPGRELIWSWHYDLLCEHLLLVKQRKTRRLIVNVPPRTAKSTIATICFPCWRWTTEPAHNFLCASYSRNLSDDHSVMRRQLLESEWFQQRWGGDFAIGAGQDMKSQFDNSRGGQMIATSVGATVTGKGGDTLIVDDPTSADEALSDTLRSNANHWFDNTLRSRLNDPATGAIVVIMQRLHEQDLTGHLLETEPGVWTQLRIPLVEDGEEAEVVNRQSSAACTESPAGAEEGSPGWTLSAARREEEAEVVSRQLSAVSTESPAGAEEGSPGWTLSAVKREEEAEVASSQSSAACTESPAGAEEGSPGWTLSAARREEEAEVASSQSSAAGTKSPAGAEECSPGWTLSAAKRESGVDAPARAESRRDGRKGRHYPFPVSQVDHFREHGDVLQPHRFTPEVVAALQARSLVFAGQYQQLPAPLEGNLIRRSQIRYYGGADPVTGALDENLPDKFDREILSVDCAFKDHADSDFVALGRIGVKGRMRYVLNVINAHLGMSGTEEAIRRELTGRRIAAVLIEDKANGTAIIERLKANVAGVIAVNPEGGKLARFMAMQPEWEAGDWYVARNAAWTPALIEQLVTFPRAKHDDMCDMLSQAAIWLQKASVKTGPENWLKYWRENHKPPRARLRPSAPQRLATDDW